MVEFLIDVGGGGRELVLQLVLILVETGDLELKLLEFKGGFKSVYVVFQNNQQDQV